MKNFILVPFKKIDNIEINGTIKQTDNLLQINYNLIGSSNVIFPKKSINPIRKEELWKYTCFEFFIADQGKPEYLEFNLSPSGDWNVYSFENYREGMKNFSIKSLPFSTANNPEKFSLNVIIDLKKIMPRHIRLECLYIAITAVIKNTSNQLSYWALNHCQDKPDFHHRDNFFSLK